MLVGKNEDLDIVEIVCQVFIYTSSIHYSFSFHNVHITIMLSGHASLFGYYSGRLLGIDTKSKCCSQCQSADCKKNIVAHEIGPVVVRKAWSLQWQFISLHIIVF